MTVNEDIKPISVSVASRVRISARLIKALGWQHHQENFRCYGVFRNSAELLIAPSWLETPSGNHPFEDVLGLREMPEPGEVVPYGEIPSSAIVTAANRIVEFSAAWTTDNQQLDLKLGSNVTMRLGWEKGKKTWLYPAVWGSILFLLGGAEFDKAQSEEIG